MSTAALPGNIRFRAFQLGKETTFGTAVAATRRVPWRLTPTVDPHWTFPDVDTGTLDQAIAPYRMATDVTAQSVGPLTYDDAPYLYAALIKSGVTPTSNKWTFSPATTSADDFEIFTGEWGDDTTDAFQYGSGVLESLELQYPQDLGPIVATANWRFANVTYPHALTSSLSVASSPTFAYAADTEIYLDDGGGTLGTTKLSNTMHDATVTITNNLDVKRFSNGSNTRFQVAGYGRGLRTVEVTITFAKSSAALTEAADWLNTDATERLLQLKTTSPTIVTGSTKYAHVLSIGGLYWMTRSEGAVGSNSTMALVGQGTYDSTVAYPFKSEVTNALSAL